MLDLKRLEEQAKDGPSDPNALAKWRILNRLHDRNESMFYKVSIPITHFVVFYVSFKIIIIIIKLSAMLACMDGLMELLAAQPFHKDLQHW